MTPKFIVFEGIDGAGKTTQIKLLAENLAKIGVESYITAEPTDMPSGKIIREALAGRLPATCAEMADMFVRDRVIHNKDEEKGIDPHLDRGITVISDRYYYSSLAYQGAELGYTVKSGETTVNEGDAVLTVNPDNGKTGETTLTFSATEEVKFAGDYTATLVFTIAVRDDGTI